MPSAAAYGEFNPAIDAAGPMRTDADVTFLDHRNMTAGRGRISSGTGHMFYSTTHKSNFSVRSRPYYARSSVDRDSAVEKNAAVLAATFARGGVGVTRDNRKMNGLQL
jgi:hypothetical protein